MIQLIVGNKGSGKTKRLIDMANEAINTSNGNVVFIEKGLKLTYDVSHRARLIDSDSYGISGFDAFYGFISGVCAGNYDVTDIFIDSTLKIGGKDLVAFSAFAAKVAALSTQTETRMVFSVSCDVRDLPEGIEAEIIGL